MKTRYVLCLTAFAAIIAATSPLVAEGVQAGDPAEGPPGGALSTMPYGTYQCALPGDAAGKAFKVVESEGFRIGAASSYRNEEGRGTYILRGDKLTFTRGPKKGQSLTRVGTNQLRRGDLLCTRLSGR